MSTRTKQEEETEVTRLTDIRTKEVSLVDRGANKQRRFLVVKKDQDMGVKDKTKKNEPEKDASPVEASGEMTQTEPAADPPAGDPPADSAPVGDPPAGEGTSFSEPERNASGEGEGTPVTEDIAKALQQASQQLADLAKANDMADIEIGLADLGDILGEISKGNVAKAGARMQGKRLEALETAVKTLNTLVKELKGMKVKPKKSDETPKVPAEPETATDVAKSDGQGGELAELLKSLNAKVDQIGTDLNGKVDQVSEGLAGLTRVVGKHGDRIDSISKNYGGGNQGAFDGDEGSPATEEISWPLDMNRPAPSRETVEKRGTSFYGE